MDLRKTCLVIVVLFLPTSTIAPIVDQFGHSRQALIDRLNTRSEYFPATLCQDLKFGEDKIACRLRNDPLVGFLVCKSPEYNGESCHNTIDTELRNLKELQSMEIRTVEVDNEIIDGVECGGNNVPNGQTRACSGFLEGWIDADKGVFKHVRDHISKAMVDVLMKEVIKYTTPKNKLTVTIDDLSKIVKFMQPDSDGNYKQICDLQGFFLKDGGFLVADTPQINKNIDKYGLCWDGEPTTNQVLTDLNTMIEEFGKAAHQVKQLYLYKN